MRDFLKYLTPSAQPGEIIGGSPADEKVTYCSTSQVDDCISQEKIEISATPQTSTAPLLPPMGTDTLQQYVGYYHYAVIPRNYFPAYSTPPPAVYNAPVYYQAVHAVKTKRQMAQCQVTYTTAVTGSTTEVTAKVEADHQVVHRASPSGTVTEIPYRVQILEPTKIMQTYNRQRLVICNYCQFCQNNRERVSFYTSHILRDANGIVVCPVLRSYNCPICNNGGGDWAHTKSYCPQLWRPKRLSRRKNFHQGGWVEQG